MARGTTDYSKAEARVTRVAGMLPARRRQAVDAIMKIAQANAQARFVPVLDGNLRNSITGRVLPDGKTGELRTNGVAYAAKQNFDFSLNHDTPDNGPEAGPLYIERGMDEGIAAAPRVISRLGGEMWQE